MKLRSRVSRTNRFTAAAIIALAMAFALAGSRTALAELAAGQAAFNKGDFTTAMGEFQRPAYAGDAVAQYYMGVIFGDGLEVNRNLEDALVWFKCAQAAGLPPILEQDAKRRQDRILARISGYDLEQVEMRTETVCDGARPKIKISLSNDEDGLVNVRPVRGFLGMLFFFPGDTTVTGAVVVFHELKLTFIRDALVNIVMYLGDILFGLIALIGWIIIGRIIHLFGEPVWKMISARDPLRNGEGLGGAAGQQGSEAEAD